MITLLLQHSPTNNAITTCAIFSCIQVPRGHAAPKELDADTDYSIVVHGILHSSVTSEKQLYQRRRRRLGIWVTNPLFY